jgi:hypothetical protein
MINWFDNADVRTQNRDFEAQIAEVKAANDQLQLQIAELNQDNGDFEAQIANVQTLTSQLQVQIAEVKAANDQLQLQIAELNQDNGDFEAQIANVQTLTSQLQVQIAEVKAANDQLQLQINQLDTRRIITITAEDGYQYSLGTSGTILTTPSIPHYIGAGSAPSGFLQEGYLTVALSSDQIATSAAFFPESIGYGTYEWKGKFEGIESGGFMGWGFHKYYRQSTDGIEVYFDPAYDGWFLWNSKNDITTSTEISSIDFTIEHKFTLEWTNTYIKLYIDDTLIAQNEENIPSDRLYPFQEIIFRQVNSPQDVYVYSKDWRKIE